MRLDIRTTLRLISAAVVAGNTSCLAATASPPPDVTKWIVSAPQPEPPLVAGRRHGRGTGIFLLRTQIKTGRVTQVIVGRSIGDTTLDAAAVKALSRWRFKPGALPYRKIKSVRLEPPLTTEEALIKVPVTFAL
jgi:TonB family protein